MNGAILGGAGGIILLTIVAAIIIWQARLTFASWILLGGIFAVVAVSMVAFYPGNLILTFPTAVEFTNGTGMVFHAPLKSLLVEYKEIRHVRHSYLSQGYVIRLKKRKRLLKTIVIHWLFGEGAQQIVQAIKLRADD